MGNEDAKERFQRAQDLCDEQRFGEAWDILEELNGEIPTSRRLIYQRATCLSGLGRYDEALEICNTLEGKLEDRHVQSLRERIVAEQKASGAADGSSNVFAIATTFPTSFDETTVTGHVVSGAFYSGDSASLISPSGVPILAPIVRIGTADTPLKMIRQGQQGIMVLKVEPHHVAPGSKLMSSATSESYAETIVAGTEPDAEAQPAREVTSSEPALQDIEGLIAERRSREAFDKLNRLYEKNPNSAGVHRLLARVRISGARELRDTKLALQHAKKALELGGDNDPGVLEVLADALGANNEAAHGIRFLERLYSLAAEPEARDAAAKRIEAYRERYKLGNVWHFVDGFGNVIYESGSIEEIANAIAKGNVPKNVQCRKNKIGDWVPIQDSLAKEYPEIRALYKKSSSTILMGALLFALVGGAGTFSVVQLQGSNADMTYTLSLTGGGALVGALMGALVGYALHSDKHAPPAKK